MSLHKSPSSQLSESEPVELEALLSRHDDGLSYTPKPKADPSHSGPAESTVPSLLGKRSRSQSPQIEYVHGLALHAAALSPGRGSTSRKADSMDTYGPSSFGGWGEYMMRKRAKLQNQNAVMQEASLNKPQVFRGTEVYVRFLWRSVSLETRLFLLP